MIINVSVDFDTVLFYALVFLFIFLFFYVLFDLHYYCTYFWLIFWCKLRRKSVPVDDATEYYGVCTTNDLDVYFEHMNNARYVRELDFARFHFYKRTGIFEYVLNENGVALQTACYIRYRKTIPLLTPYKIRTKIIYWDAKNLYLEHQFMQLSDGFVTTQILCKQAFLRVNIEKMMNKLLGKTFIPKPPPELVDFINLNKSASAQLRNDCM